VGEVSAFGHGLWRYLAWAAATPNYAAHYISMVSRDATDRTFYGDPLGHLIIANIYYLWPRDIFFAFSQHNNNDKFRGHRNISLQLQRSFNHGHVTK